MYPSPERRSYERPEPRRQRFELEEDDREEQQPEPAKLKGGSQPTVAGSRAVLKGGIAYAPERAPEAVKRAIWAINTLRKKPYRYGGGHGTFFDSGYDCSGTVSFALYHAGALRSPLPSRGFTGYGNRGKGDWITVYARPGHTFAVIAGLRLDTTDLYTGRDVGPRWHTDYRSPSGFTARHPEGL